MDDKLLQLTQDTNRKMRESAFGKDSFSIAFQVTGECNFRCTYCYEEKKPEKMSLSDGIALIDKLFPIEDNIVWWNGYLRNATDKTHIRFDFFGGECTLEIDTLEALCQHFADKCDEDPERYAERKKNLIILLETNGSLLRTPKVEAFLRKWEDHITMGISLDGSQEFHDKCRRFKNGGPTWQIVKDNLVWLIKTFPNMKFSKVKSTITSETIPYVYESYKLFRDIGLPAADASIALGCPWKEGDVERLKEQYELILNDMLNDPHPIVYNAFEADNIFRNSFGIMCGKVGTCGSAGEAIALSSDNKLYTCVQFSHITMHGEGLEDFSIGTVKDGISDHGIEIANMILNSYDKYSIVEGKCQKCLMRPLCEYCPAFSYRATKDINLMEKDRCALERLRTTYGMRFKYEMEKRKWQRKNLA